jgi:multidrug efflux pump subunit AcrA (membrane-fusion protein)
MATVPNPIEAAPARPSIVTLPHPVKTSRSKWLRWAAVAGLALALAAAGAHWRTHLQNAITYQTVPVERGSVQAKVTATGNLNAVVDVLVSSQVSGNKVYIS